MKGALKFELDVPYSQAIIAPDVVARVFRTKKQASKNHVWENLKLWCPGGNGSRNQRTNGKTHKNTVNSRVSCLVPYDPTYCHCYHHSFSFKPEAHDKSESIKKTKVMAPRPQLVTKSM